HAGPGRIEVCNAAPGLDQDDLVHFGERFWRKQPGPGHFGLGLALACATADALQMALSFELVHGELQAVLCWRAWTVSTGRRGPRHGEADFSAGAGCPAGLGTGVASLCRQCIRPLVNSS